MTSLLLLMSYRAFACDSAPAGCDANWHCELVMDGMTGDSSDIPVGAGIEERTATNKLWFVINRVENDDVTGGAVLQQSVALRAAPVRDPG